MLKAVITGTGSYLPERKVTNQDLEGWTFVNSKGEKYNVTSQEIIEKTGILQRRYEEEKTPLSEMAAIAGKRAIENARLHPDEIDLLLVATSTPDYTIPKVAPMTASKIEMHGLPAYDFGKDCTGFIEALEAASYYIQAGRYENILVIGAEKSSHFINPKNKATAVIFGDGAGAVVLSARENTDRGFLTAVAGSQGHSAEHLYVPMGGTKMPFQPGMAQESDKLIMNGKEVAGYASQVFAVGVERVLAQQQLVAENLDLLVPHQSNLRIIEAGAKALDIPMSKVIITIDKLGNTAAASIPTALDIAVKDGRIKEGYLLSFVAYGAGFSWIAALLRY